MNERAFLTLSRDPAQLWHYEAPGSLGLSNSVLGAEGVAVVLLKLWRAAGRQVAKAAEHQRRQGRGDTGESTSRDAKKNLVDLRGVAGVR